MSFYELRLTHWKLCVVIAERLANDHNALGQKSLCVRQVVACGLSIEVGALLIRCTIASSIAAVVEQEHCERCESHRVEDLEPIQAVRNIAGVAVTEEYGWSARSCRHVPARATRRDRPSSSGPLRTRDRSRSGSPSACVPARLESRCVATGRCGGGRGDRQKINGDACGRDQQSRRYDVVPHDCTFRVPSSLTRCFSLRFLWIVERHFCGLGVADV